MRTTIQMYIGALTIILSSCQSDKSKRLENENNMSIDTTFEAQLVEDLIGKQMMLDIRLNPFVDQKDSVDLESCETNKDIEAAFNCIISQFKNGFDTHTYWPNSRA